MKQHILTLAAALILTGAATVCAADAPRTIAVTGTGSVTAPADTAVIHVIIDSRAPTAAAAARDNAAAARQVRNAVIAAGANEDIPTENYLLRPEYDQKNPARIKEYAVQHAMKVTVKDLSRTGAVSDAAVHAGAGRIGSVVFSLENEEAWRKEAIRHAAAQARKEADLIAAELGCTITGVLSAQTASARPASGAMLRNAAAADASTVLAPDEQEITATVSIVYEIE